MLTPTNLKITVASCMCSHRCMRANPEIDESGDTVLYYNIEVWGIPQKFCAMRELLVRSEALMQG